MPSRSSRISNKFENALPVTVEPTINYSGISSNRCNEPQNFHLGVWAPGTSAKLRALLSKHFHQPHNNKERSTSYPFSRQESGGACMEPLLQMYETPWFTSCVRTGGGSPNGNPTPNP